MMRGRQQLGIERLRAVLDTNIYVAAYLAKNPNSPTVELLKRWRNGEFDVLYCQEMLYEIARKFQEKVIPPRYTITLISDLKSLGQVVFLQAYEVTPIILDDPDDDILVACAKVGGATHIVTYDPHFEVLDGEYEGIKVLDGLHFLYVVRGDVIP
jgi:predicted nucleic acid-binding protein